MENNPSEPIYKLKAGWVKKINDLVIKCKFEDNSTFEISAGLYALHYRRGDEVIVYSFIDNDNAPDISHMITINNRDYSLMIFASEIIGGFKILSVKEYIKKH